MIAIKTHNFRLEILQVKSSPFDSFILNNGSTTAKKKKKFDIQLKNCVISVLVCLTNRACASRYQSVGVWARCTQDLSNMEVLIDG